MAPLPDNNTSRLFVDYIGSMGPRTMQFRCNDGITPGEAVSRVSQFIANAIVPIWYVGTQTVGARFQFANQDFSLPVTFTTLTGTATGTLAPESYPRFISVVGRGTVIGKRVRLYVYGHNVAVSSNYRLTPGEVPAVANILTTLETLKTQGCFRTIGNEFPTLQQYLNSGINSYYQRKARA